MHGTDVGAEKKIGIFNEFSQFGKRKPAGQISDTFPGFTGDQVCQFPFGFAAGKDDPYPFAVTQLPGYRSPAFPGPSAAFPPRPGMQYHLRTMT